MRFVLVLMKCGHHAWLEYSTRGYAGERHAGCMSCAPQPSWAQRLSEADVVLGILEDL